MVVISPPTSLLPRKAIVSKPFWLVGKKIVFFTFLVIKFNFLVEVWQLVLALVAPAKLAELDVQWIALECFVFVLSLQNYFIEHFEPAKGIDRSASSFLRVEKFIALRISSLVDLNTVKSQFHTFFRGLPRPRPDVGGARSSPSGPVECFYLVWV